MQPRLRALALSIQKRVNGPWSDGGRHQYTGWPRKNATTLIVNFMNIVDETELFKLFYLVLVEHSFSNKMTP